MKKLMLVIVISLTLFSCNEETSHEVQWSSDGKDSVVEVNYVREDGTKTNFFMNYLLYQQLFNKGGYSAVYDHYNTHSADYHSQRSKYQGYKSRSTISNSSSKSYSRPYVRPRSYSRPHISPHH